ncbi:multiple epidermal growth factor-like domains protein 6 [Episyrphus balteatus]|uniref:multiple epidermal growth factor-like domains protein 6 n=1 Tax=Episyrphus balteatus TaxID=286459 RepID=UPI00248682E1|nr:multiple epidermal growth factor-like domains protein 6 [Episyrphus balteatus]
MKTCLLTYGLLFIISIVTASRPATGPSGTVCESAGGSCKGIHDGTMIPYKGDCGKYIVCFLNCGCDRPCPDGLHFNPVKQTCDYPSKAGCNPSWVDPPTGSPGNECQSPESSCKNITDGTLISFGNDCTQYIQCLNGCTHHRSCPPGTHFSSKSKRCLMPSDAGCDPSPGNLNPDPSCPGCSQPSGPQCQSVGGSCKNVSDGTLISYANDCTKYIQCSKGCGTNKDCPAGLHFSPKFQVCTVPSKAGCDLSPGHLNPDPSCPGCSQPSGPQCQSVGGSCKNVSDGTLISYANDCTKYIQCSKGCGTNKDCPAGLHFSPKFQVCTVPSKAGCDLSPGNLNPDPSCPGCSQPSGPQCQSVGGSCKNVSDGTLISYANDCTKYIQCSKGCGTNKDCPAGLHFSPKFQVCTVPSKAGCDLSPGNLNPDPSCPGCSQPSGPQCQSVGGSCKNVSDGTLISYANDCTKYIQCSKGCGTNKDCPAGLHFSPKFQVCTAPSKAECDLSPGHLNPDPSCPGCSQPSGPQCQSVGGSCKNVSDGTLISYANDCTKYIQCSKGCGTNKDCPAGLHFSPKFKVCTAPSKAGCDLSPGNLNPDPSCPGCSQPSGPECQSVGGSCENISDGTLISYANDCTKYIQCSKRCGTNMDCPAGLHFSPKFKVCTAPSKAGCDLSPGNLNPDPSCPGCSQPSGPQCQSAGGSCKYVSDGTLISYANDCTKYIQCSKGCGTNKNCPAGLHFCPKLQVCTAPSKAGCDPSAGNLNPDPSCPGCSQPSGSQCQSVGGSCKNVSDGTLISYANDCTKYIQCSKGCGTNMDCPAGLHFCPKLKVCTAPSKAGCDPAAGNLNPDPSCPGCSQPSGPQCQSVGGSCKNVSDGTLISYANDCTKYIQCSKGCGTNMHCPAGLHFSPKFQVCTAPSKAECDLSPGHLNPDPSCPGCSQPSGPQCQSVGGSCENVSDGILISYANDCTKYIQCSKGCGTNKDCPAGLHFCLKLQECTVPAKAGCDPSAGNSKPNPPCPCATPGSEPKPNYKPEPISPNPSPSISSPSTSQPSKPSIKPSPGSVQNSCSGQEAGKLLPFPKNCTKFIACSSDGLSYIMECGSGSHFNAALELCDWPEDAGCDPSYVKPEINPNCQSKGTSCLGKEDGKLLPYPDDCQRFYACADGCEFEMACGENLHFNQYLEVCDWPKDAGCDPALNSTTSPCQTC